MTFTLNVDKSIVTWGEQAILQAVQTTNFWSQHEKVKNISAQLTGFAFQQPNVIHRISQQESPKVESTIEVTLRSKNELISIKHGTSLHTVGERPLWNHLLVIDISSQNLSSLPGPWIVCCELLVADGRISAGLSIDSSQHYSSDEVHFSKSSTFQKVHLELCEPKGTNSLIFRNTNLDQPSSKSEFQVCNIQVFQARRVLNKPYDIDSVNEIPIPWLTYFAESARGKTMAAPEPSKLTPSIDKLSAGELGLLIAKNTLTAPQTDYLTPFNQWTMHDNDAPILAYIYHLLNPENHLEFGTWEGFGTKLCAQNCYASIWTINLPEGEASSSGSPVYASGDQASDSGTRIGRLYKEAGFEHRVTQILCDSTQWDSSAFSDGFFDSVLIDGGHTTPVVCNDTRLAIRLLRSGGLCLWHDFCPDPNIIRSFDSVRGVVRAICHHFEDWSQYFDQVIWIERSFLLLGVRNSKHYLIDEKVR